MYGGKAQGTQAPTAFGSLLQASTYGMTIPVPYGRVQSNLLAIWANNLREGGSSKKGKSGKKGVTTYVERIDFLLGKNPILGVLQLWNNGTKYPLVDTVYSTTVAAGGAAAITIPDSHFYAVIGVKLFGAAGHPMQPYFASIHEACFTLFRILTGDDWTQMRYELAQAGQPLGAFTAYQVSWIVVATFLLVNLIVGAVINNYQKVQDIEEHCSLARDTSEQRMQDLVRELEAILAARAKEPTARG